MSSATAAAAVKMKGMLKCKCEKNQKGVTPPIWDTWPFDGVPYCKKSQKNNAWNGDTHYRFQGIWNWKFLSIKKLRKIQIEFPKISKCAEKFNFIFCALVNENIVGKIT